ncbi:hypothetical protein Mapa_003080 [Marchantia paleacea]|nr:hypothetical protein Mapa_003080 [Marchantia paleacea]
MSTNCCEMSARRPPPFFFFSYFLAADGRFRFLAFLRKSTTCSGRRSVSVTHGRAFESLEESNRTHGARRRPTRSFTLSVPCSSCSPEPPRSKPAGFAPALVLHPVSRRPLCTSPCATHWPSVTLVDALLRITVLHL